MRARQFGFALVEVLVIATIVAIIVGFTIVAVTATRPDHTSQKACQKDAVAFQKAVSNFHAKEGRWPGERDTSKELSAVVDELILKGYIPRSLVDHVDGSLRVPTTEDRGWLYDFDHHVTFSATCR